jgi:hypothetical protein
MVSCNSFKRRRYTFHVNEETYTQGTSSLEAEILLEYKVPSSTHTHTQNSIVSLQKLTEIFHSILFQGSWVEIGFINCDLWNTNVSKND